MLFKEGIVPEWEDAKNRDGGRWLLTTVSSLLAQSKIKKIVQDKKKRAADLDRIWLETLLCLIGEAFDDASEDVSTIFESKLKMTMILDLWGLGTNSSEK